MRNEAYIILAYILFIAVAICFGRMEKRVKALESEAKAMRSEISILHVEKEITESRLKSIENATIYKTKESKP